jgi:hypothetical protein
MTRVASLALLLLLAPLTASAQGLSPADAGDFMGVWSIMLDTPQGSFEQVLTVKEENSKVVAEMTSQMQPEAQKITNVAKDAGNLVLKFSGDFQGNPFDATVTVTPDGADKAKVIFDINGGQFTMGGAGTRTKKAAG